MSTLDVGARETKSPSQVKAVTISPRTSPRALNGRENMDVGFSNELVHHLVKIHRMIHDQKLINKRSERYHAYNMYMNFMNSVKSTAMNKNVKVMQNQIEEGRQVVGGLLNTVETHAELLAAFEAELEKVESNMKTQEENVTTLTSSMEEETKFLKKLMDEYDQKLAKQQQAITEQEKALSKILSRRFRVDFGIDIGIILLSGYLSDMRVVTFLSQSFYSALLLPVTMEAARKATLNRNLIRCTKLLLFFALFRQFRALAVQYGIHSRTGTINDYAKHLGAFGKDAILNAHLPFVYAGKVLKKLVTLGYYGPETNVPADPTKTEVDLEKGEGGGI